MFSGFALCIALLFWTGFLAFPERIMGLFIKNPELVRAGRIDTMLSICAFPLDVIMIINVTLFQAIGKPKPAGFMVMARQLFLYIPAAVLLPLCCGARGVWIATPISDTIVALMTIVIVIKVFKTDLAGRKSAQAA